MTKTYFILGTDTDCGKTYATVALLNYFKQQNVKARAIKPVASGCREESHAWINDDIRCLQQANDHHSAPIHHWLMRPPISPHLAAKAEGVSISADKIKTFYESYPKQDLKYLFIEGAGGLFVPLNEQETWVDFLVLTRTPVILVVGMRLGCLNHALLTAYALIKQHIPCYGWIANFIDPQMQAQTENLQTLQNWLQYPHIGSISYQGVFAPTAGFA